MTVIGIDAHKDWHTLVAVDEVGRRIKELTVEARAAGHRRIMTWLEGFEDVTVAVEDCRHLTRRLEADLLEAGHRVVRVHTRLMAGMRRSSRERGKSDPIDAEAVARVALREEGLPTAELPGASRDIKLLSDHRRTLVARRTAMQSKARWFLHEIDPELEIPSRALRRYHLLDELIEYLEPVEGAVAEIARDLLVDIRELTVRINTLESRLSRLVRASHPSLVAVPGMGTLGAAMIIGETAGIARFRSRDAYARFNGTAPIPVWSGNKVRVRLSRGGNRTINTALHMAALTQIRMGAEGAAYYDKLITAGKTRKEALRLLRRRLSDRVYAAQRADVVPAAQAFANPVPMGSSTMQDPASSVTLMAA